LLSSAVPFLQSEAIKTTTVFLSNPLLLSHSYLQSVLEQTFCFGTENHEFKVSVASVNMASTMAGSMVGVALIGIVSLWFIVRRKHSVDQIDHHMEGIDLSIEHPDEEESYGEEESFFDVKRRDDQMDPADPLGSGSLVQTQFRDSDDLCMRFDGEECLSSLLLI
jgi:hypothetical protein